jgi:hypothetical protein
VDGLSPFEMAAFTNPPTPFFSKREMEADRWQGNLSMIYVSFHVDVL